MSKESETAVAVVRDCKVFQSFYHKDVVLSLGQVDKLLKEHLSRLISKSIQVHGIEVQAPSLGKLAPTGVNPRILKNVQGDGGRRAYQFYFNCLSSSQ